MFADFMHFYNYTAEQALNEYAVRFFGLSNSMYRIQGNNRLMELVITNQAVNGDGDSTLYDELKRQSKGNHGILQEVRNIKK